MTKIRKAIEQWAPVHSLEHPQDNELRAVKQILKHSRRASQEVLKAGLPITTLKGNSIVKTYPDGTEKEIASILGTDSHIKVIQKKFSIR